MITYRYINSLEQCLALQTQWQQLEKNSPYCNALMTFAWQTTFIEQRLNGRAFHGVVAVKQDTSESTATEQLVYLQLFVEDQVSRMGLKMQALCALNDNQTLSVAPLIAADFTPDWAQISKLLKQHAGRGWLVYLPRLEQATSLQTYSGQAHINEFCEMGYSLDTRPDSDSIQQGFKSNLRSNLKKASNKLKKTEHQFHWYQGEAAVAQLATLIDVEHASWKGEAKTSIQSSESDVQFYQALSQKLAAQGDLIIQTLSFGEQVVAANWLVRQGKGLLLWKLAYRQEHSKASPGNLLMLDLIAQCQAQQLEFIDLLTGENWYENWGMTPRPFNNVALFTGSAWASRAALTFSLLSKAKQLKQRIRG